MPRKKRDMTIEELEAMKAALEADIDKLEFKRAVLEGTVELLGKGQGADPRMLANREKAILVESLRPAHKLKDLLDVAGLARSSRRYQMAAMAKPDKYADLRIRICEISHEVRGCYGYRRIHSVLRVEGVTVSEKVELALTVHVFSQAVGDGRPDLAVRPGAQLHGEQRQLAGGAGRVGGRAAVAAHVHACEFASAVNTFTVAAPGATIASAPASAGSVE